MCWTDDPVRDAARYDLEMERREQRMRDSSYAGKCLQCGEPVYDYEDYYDIDGDLLHSDCMIDYMNQFLVHH